MNSAQTTTATEHFEELRGGSGGSLTTSASMLVKDSLALYALDPCAPELAQKLPPNGIVSVDVDSGMLLIVDRVSLEAYRYEKIVRAADGSGYEVPRTFCYARACVAAARHTWNRVLFAPGLAAVCGTGGDGSFTVIRSRDGKTVTVEFP